jgi:hypothetical protein
MEMFKPSIVGTSDATLSTFPASSNQKKQLVNKNNISIEIPQKEDLKVI